MLWIKIYYNEICLNKKTTTILIKFVHEYKAAREFICKILYFLETIGTVGSSSNVSSCFTSVTGREHA